MGIESCSWVMSLSPSGGGGELWQGYACTVSVSHGWMLEPTCKEWAMGRYTVALVASSSGRSVSMCCAVAVVAARSGISVPGSFPIFPVPPPLSKLLCLVHGPGNSSGRADSEVTGGTGPPTPGGSSWTLSHGSILRANGCPSLGAGTEGCPPGDPSPGPCHFPERLLLYQKSALSLPVGVMGSCSGYMPYYLEGHDQRC